MHNRKISLTLNLEDDEQLNKEIDEIIRARVIAVTRSECDVAINGIVKNEATRILSDRIAKLNTDTNVRDLAKQVIRSYLTQIQGTQAIREAVFSVIESDELQSKINKLIENAVSFYCADYVKKTLGKVVPADVIAAVVNAMDQKRKEGEAS